jgi:gas vesicle protein
MSDNESDLGAFLAGFVIGGLAGAAAALIMAPQSGAETRAQIASKGDDYRLAGEAQLHDAQERARIVLDEGKSKVSGARGKDGQDDAAAAEDVAETDEPGDATS